MITKMKFINITGPKSDIDRVVSKYLSVYPIHLENALSELDKADRLTPYIETNPYKETTTRLESMAKVVNKGNLDLTANNSPTLTQANALIKQIEVKSDKLNEERELLEKKKAHYEEVIRKITPFKQAGFDLSEIMKFKYIKYRFGRIALTYYDKFSQYVYENLNTIFIECSRDRDYVWGVYFSPQVTFVKVDAIFASMHFERSFLPDEYHGPPEDVYAKLMQAYQKVNQDIEECNRQLTGIYDHSKQEINDAYVTIHQLYTNFDIRKQAACTKERSQVFYILCGWMAEKNANAFKNAAEKDEDVFVIIEDDHDGAGAMPPTQLINRGIFKPFQMFIQMYGLPAYNELDPTKFIALTYAFMFGIMFGDVGQGACLAVGGYLLYKFKRMNIAGIISFCGLFSVFFGFMFGSIFGFEDVISAIWLRPMESENMMTVLALAVAFGVILILIAMFIHLINAIKQKNIGAFLFGTNGLTGILFYVAVIYIVLTKLLPALGPTKFMSFLIILIALCLIGIAFHEPLMALVDKQKFQLHDSKVMFIVQAFFELFEIVLSYLTNTISFIRVGAFALSHVGMMSVVMMLSHIENGVNPTSIVIVILGNLLISGLEGLIVGIQVLRLEYYEMFSRFYSGSGREFKPYQPETNRSSAQHINH